MRKLFESSYMYWSVEWETWNLSRIPLSMLVTHYWNSTVCHYEKVTLQWVLLLSFVFHFKNLFRPLRLSFCFAINTMKDKVRSWYHTERRLLCNYLNNLLTLSTKLWYDLALHISVQTYISHSRLDVILRNQYYRGNDRRPPKWYPELSFSRWGFPRIMYIYNPYFLLATFKFAVCKL